MKKAYFLSILFFSVLFSCSSDEHNDPKLSSDFLKQTKWSGPFIFVQDGNVKFKANVSLFFTTSERGYYSFDTYASLSGTEFNYSIDDRLLTIETSYGREYLKGDWILTDIRNDKLYFKKGIEGYYYSYTMELTRDRIQRNR